MRELLMVVALVGGFALLTGLFFVPWEPLARLGLWLLALGTAAGIPAGVVYHVLLYRALAPRGALPRGWIWNPIRHNARLEPAERPAVLGFCYAGALGYGVMCLGILLLVVALVSGLVLGRP